VDGGVGFGLEPGDGDWGGVELGDGEGVDGVIGVGAVAMVGLLK
jgi:hypothetical protein